ncbi:hypothetical protein JCM9534A_41940 [Catenuloplanes indicus JCM 9534]
MRGSRREGGGTARCAGVGGYAGRRFGGAAKPRDEEEPAVVRPGGQPNMQQLMKQAAKLQQAAQAAQAELAEAEVTGTAGGGLVTVTMAGTGEVRSVKIDPKVIDPDDPETLEDTVLAALHNAAEGVRALTEEKMGPVTGGLGGLGMGF